jgi:hypothetical protein
VIRLRLFGTIDLQVDPDLEPLRDHPPCRELLKPKG